MWGQWAQYQLREWGSAEPAFRHSVPALSVLYSHFLLLEVVLRSFIHAELGNNLKAIDSRVLLVIMEVRLATVSREYFYLLPPSLYAKINFMSNLVAA